MVNGTATLALRPAVQLDSRETYYATVNLAHRELPAPAAPVSSNSATADTVRLLHFNGRLDFGPIETRIEALANDPAAAATLEAGSPAPAVLTSPQLSLGRLLSPREAWTFGDGSGLSLRLLPDGRALYLGASPVNLIPPVPLDKDRQNGMAFVRIGTVLSTTGLSTSLGVLVPPGMNVTSSSDSRMGIPVLSLGSQVLDAALQPTLPAYTYSPAEPVWVSEETKPVLLKANSITWVRADGRLDVDASGEALPALADDLFALDNSPAPLPQKIKRGNDGYYRSVISCDLPVSFRTLPGNSGAHLTATLFLGTDRFATHFPHDVSISFDNGQLVIEDDLLRPASVLNGVEPIVLAYEQGCLTSSCSIAPPRSGSFRLAPTNQELRLTDDGGLVCTGTLDSGSYAGDRTNLLEWGYSGLLGNGGLKFAHQVLDRFSTGTFHATGHFLRGPASNAAMNQRPVVVHHSGFFAATPAAPPERPGSAGYIQGQADYAGVNLRAANEPATLTGVSRVADTPTPVYPLKARSKYYVRAGGVSGIHDANWTAQTFTLYGFPVTLDNFSFGFNDSRTLLSATQGEIVVPYPSAFTQRFEQMHLTCLGDLEKATIPDDSEPGTLAYWGAEFRPHTFEMQKQDGCSPGGAAILAMHIETNVHHIPDPLYGQVGWYSNGRIVPPSDVNYSITSRFELPPTIFIAGPNTETYRATPASEAYFNSYDAHPVPANQPPAGFISFAVRLDVPFFQDLDVHLHSFARPLMPLTGAPPSRLHFMGGWTTSGGKTFFNQTTFDPSHRGFPDTLPTVSLATYRNDGAHRLPAPPDDPGDDPYRAYRVYAKREFLDDNRFFEYPIEFLSGARVWTATAPQRRDLLVFNLGHQLDLMSPSHADITFGVRFETLPIMNLSNAAFGFVDELAANAPAGGFSSILAGVLGGPEAAALNAGLSSLDTVLGDNLSFAVNRMVGPSLNPQITAAYNDLRAAHLNGTLAGATPVILSNLETQLLARLSSTTLVANPASAGGTSLSLLSSLRGEISSALGSAIAAIDVLAGPPGGGPGLFSPAGDYSLSRNLIRAIVSEASPEAGAIVAEIAGPLLDELIGDLLARSTPTLDSLRGTLLELRQQLDDLRQQVDSTNGSFAQALRNAIAASSADFDAVTDAVTAEIQAILNQEAQRYLVQLPASAFENRVRARLTSRLLSRPLCAQLLGLVRQYLYDLDSGLRSSAESGLRVTNGIVRKLLVEVIEEAVSEFTEGLGGLSASLAAANIDGYARINGDSLRTLRLDMTARAELMSSMEADFFFQIDIRQSTGDEACSWGAAGDYYTEVMMGANNVEADWLGEMRINAMLKFTLADNGVPLGMGGSIELAGGKAKYESFTLTEFGATAMFGAEENYVGAKARAEYNKKAIKVAFFFGRTCSIEPLKFVDKDVVDILGNPPFTGGYVYGEVSYPLNELLGIPTTCFLSLTGTVGVGVWVFIENPEYGGKLYMRIVGEVICVAEIGGEMTLLGGKSGNDYVLSGKGRLWVELCALICFEGEAGVRVKCRNSDCDFTVDI